MASRSLGTLTLDLVAKIGGFVNGMDQAARISEKRMKQIERQAYALGNAMGTALKIGAVAAVGAITLITKNAIDAADEMRDLSIRVGVSTEVLSGYGYAAKQTGTDIDTLGRGLKILAKNAADAINPTSEQAKIFDALGVSVTDSTGKLKNLDQLVPAIADKFKALEDGTTKAALAQALFGKSGLELTEFLNQGSQGLDDFAAKAEALGIIIDSKTAAAADEFKDTLGDLKAAVGGLGLGIARELLPALQAGATDMVDLVKQGDLAHDMAIVLGSAFSAAAGILTGYTKAVNITSTAMEYLARISNDFITIQKNLSTFGFADGTIAGAARDIKAATAEGDAQLKAIHAPAAPQMRFIDGGGTIDGESLAQYQGRNARQATSDAQLKRLQDALANKSGGKSSKARAGKSDAEREAEKVARAIEQMTKAQQDWQNELSKTGNPIADEFADRLREVAEQGKEFAKDGVPADKVKAFTDEMTKLATTMRDEDIAQFQKEFNEETATMAAQMQGPAAAALQQYRLDVEKLDDELKHGVITLDEYNARIAVLGKTRDSPMSSVLGDIQEQIKLLGMTNEQQEIYNNLKSAGVDANSEWGQSIIGATEALQKMREQTAFLDDVKASLSDMFVDFATGAKSAKEAFGDFADHIYATALKWLADKAIQALFDGFGKGGTGSTGTSTGGGWAGLFTSILGAFGGGKAGGGSVTPGKFYEVGEYDRPEILMSRGKQYLIPGNAGNVTPVGSGSGDRRGSTVIQNFSLSRRNDNRSERQIAQATGRAIRMAN